MIREDRFMSRDFVLWSLNINELSWSFPMLSTKLVKSEKNHNPMQHRSIRAEKGVQQQSIALSLLPNWTSMVLIALYLLWSSCRLTGGLVYQIVATDRHGLFIIFTVKEFDASSYLYIITVSYFISKLGSVIILNVLSSKTFNQSNLN